MVAVNRQGSLLPFKGVHIWRFLMRMEGVRSIYAFQAGLSFYYDL